MNYKQALSAFLEGKTVESRYPSWPDSQEWRSLEDETSEHLGGLLRGEWDDEFEFRLKPRTVKIGSRDVEAPVLDPVEGQMVYEHRSYVDGKHFVRALPFDSGLAASAVSGKLFSNKDAAIAAFDAIQALLRGEA